MPIIRDTTFCHKMCHFGDGSNVNGDNFIRNARLHQVNGYIKALNSLEVKGIAAGEVHFVANILLHHFLSQKIHLGAASSVNGRNFMI